MVYIVNGLKPYAYALDVFFELMTKIVFEQIAKYRSVSTITM